MAQYGVFEFGTAEFGGAIAAPSAAPTFDGGFQFGGTFAGTASPGGTFAGGFQLGGTFHVSDYAETDIVALSKKAVYAVGSAFGHLPPFRVFQIGIPGWGRIPAVRVFHVVNSGYQETGITAIGKNAVISTVEPVFRGGFVLGGTFTANGALNGSLAAGFVLGGAILGSLGLAGAIAGGFVLGGSLGATIAYAGIVDGGFVLGGGMIGPLDGIDSSCVTGDGLVDMGDGGGDGGIRTNRIF